MKLTQSLGENTNQSRLNKKVKEHLDTYLKNIKPESPDFQYAILHCMKGAFVDSNFHKESDKLDKYFPKANQSKFVNKQMENLIRSKGYDIARFAKWDINNIIDAFSYYMNTTVGGGFGDKFEKLKVPIGEGIIVESEKLNKDFFENNKHGIAIHKLLNGGDWNRSKVKKYFDSLGNGNNTKWLRYIEFIANYIMIDPKKYDNRPTGDFVYTVIDKIGDMYNEYNSNEQNTMNEAVNDISSYYDKLKKGDLIKIKYDSSISRGVQNTFQVTKGKTNVGKYGVERIILRNVSKPNSTIKYYLYNRNGKISMAVGDMGVVIRDVEMMNESVNEASIPNNEAFIPKVGTIDDFELKNLLMKNPKVNTLLGNSEKDFMKKSDVVAIIHQSKPFNTILTDGKDEFEIDMKANKLVKPLTVARKEIQNHFSKNESRNNSINEGIWPKSKLSDKFQFLLSDEIRKNFKGIFYVIGYDLYHNDEKVMTINPDKDSVNSIIKSLKSKVNESVNESGGTLKIEKRKDGKYYWTFKFKSGKVEDWPYGFDNKADAQKDFMYRSKYFSESVNEDETQDKLDDLSAAFQDSSVENYVSLLKKYQSDPKVAAVLKAGMTDGNPNDEKFKVSKATYFAKVLKPTQNEIGAEESLKNICTDQYGSLAGFLKGKAKFPEPIITFNAEFVLDGHHRWSQVYAAEPNARIPAINVSGKFEPKDILKVIHTAIAVDAGATKTINANLKAGNLLEFTPDKTKKFVMDELQDKARKVWNTNGYKSDEAIANRIAKNVEAMIQNSKPENWAPERSSMPQPGASGSEQWEKKLARGEVNVINPKSSDVKKESVNEGFSKEDMDRLKKAITSLESRIKKQRTVGFKVSNAKDEDYLNQLKRIYKNMGGTINEDLNKEIKVNDTVTVTYPTLTKPLIGKVKHILKSPTGLIYVLDGNKGVWDEKHVSLKESVNESVNWAEFYKMAKDTTGSTLNKFEKKYGRLVDIPHIKDALENTKDFKSFMAHINKFESVNEGARIVLVDPNTNQFKKTVSYSGPNRDADAEVEKLNKKLSNSEKQRGFYWKIAAYESVNERLSNTAMKRKSFNKMVDALNTLISIAEELVEGGFEKDEIRKFILDKLNTRLNYSLRESVNEAVSFKDGKYHFYSKNGMAYLTYGGKELSSGDWDGDAHAYFMNHSSWKGQKAFDDGKDVIRHFKKNNIITESSREVVKESVVNGAELKYRKTLTKKEWNKVQKDSKTIIDGVHYMMFLDDKLGTILAPVKVEESVNEGAKRFYQQDGVGKAKYTISYHDGKSTHTDGSDFYNIAIFKNKKDLESFKSELLKKGYREDSGFKNEGNVSDTDKSFNENVSGIKKGSRFGRWTVTNYEPVQYDEYGAPHGGLIKLVNQDTMEIANIVNNLDLRGAKWYISTNNKRIMDTNPNVVIQKFVSMNEKDKVVKEPVNESTENFIGFALVKKNGMVKDLDSLEKEPIYVRDILPIYRKEGGSYVVKSLMTGNALKVPAANLMVKMKDAYEPDVWNKLMAKMTRY